MGSALVLGPLGSAGCGGTALCQTEVVVRLVPAQNTQDLDSFAPGVQTSVRVETTLFVGDLVTLEVLDVSGTSLATQSRAVDADRGAEFDYVTVPAPRAVLRATGEGVCGRAEDEVTIEVPAGAAERAGAR